MKIGPEFLDLQSRCQWVSVYLCVSQKNPLAVSDLILPPSLPLSLSPSLPPSLRSVCLCTGNTRHTILLSQPPKVRACLRFIFSLPPFLPPVMLVTLQSMQYFATQTEG